jgi:hypothetical protein
MKITDLTNSQLVVLALARLGGGARAVDTEDIAIEAYAIAPKQFGWRKYPERIHLETVRIALKDALRIPPPLVQGGSKNGWMLTSDGMEWSMGLLGQEVAIDRSKRQSVIAAVEAERERLKTTNAYKLYIEQRIDTISIMDLFEFARINEYFPERARRERRQALENVVQGDEELTGLWQVLKDRFNKELRANEDQ